MERINLDAVVSTIDKLLAGAVDHRQMPAAVEQMRVLFDGSKACFARVGANLGPEDCITTNPDEALQRLYYTEFGDEFDSLTEGMGAIPVGKIYEVHKLVGEERNRSTRLWREWMAPQDMYGGIACRVLKGGSSQWFFDVQRGRNQTPFGSSHFDLFERLTPVLRRVAELRHHIGVLEIERDMTRGAMDVLSVAVIVVDRSLRLVYANAMADDLLASPRAAIGLRSGIVYARDRSEQAALRHSVGCGQLVSASPRGRTQMLMRGPAADSPSLSLCVLPMPAGYRLSHDDDDILIVARVHEPAAGLAEAAQQLFSFTETEAHFAVALASGLSLAQAADRLGVRISTARTHLARIFHKTDTHQQSQVAALLRSAELPLRGD